MGSDANAWGNWDAAHATVEDAAFGFVVMENGATVYLESSWALNTLDEGEALTSLCGTLAGADMKNGLRINGEEFGRLYTKTPILDPAGVAFYDGKAETAGEAEARLWIEAIKNDTAALVLAEQALVVTEILEAIYTSSKSGDIVHFGK